MNRLIDSLRFMVEAVSHGPVYALALSRIRNLQPLDPEENWEYWATPFKVVKAVRKIKDLGCAR
jgi:hypothetical protein